MKGEKRGKKFLRDGGDFMDQQSGALRVKDSPRDDTLF